MKTGSLSAMIKARHESDSALNLEQAQAAARETYQTVKQMLDDHTYPMWMELSLPPLFVAERQTIESLHIWWGCFKVWMDGVRKFAPSLWVKLNTARIQWP